MFIFVACLFFQVTSYSKYVFSSTLDAVDINVDRVKPILSVLDVQNSNTKHTSYASKKHTITLNVQEEEKNMNNVGIDKEKIEILVGGKIVKPSEVKISNVSKDGQKAIYKIIISGITGDGNLQVKFKEGTVVDMAGWKNEQCIHDTKIIIDNTIPDITFLETLISKGNSQGKITSNEVIEGVSGWNIDISKKILSKNYEKNTSEQVTITDYAGNENNISIKIEKADYVDVTYAIHQSNIGWTYGYTNKKIAGKQIYQKDLLLKMESLAFNVKTNLGSDFVRARAFVYTHWGTTSNGKCNTTGLIYSQGYNPSNSTWKSMNSTDLVTHNGSKYFQFGGGGINQNGGKDANGKNAIPPNIAAICPYGICGINMSLKSYDEFSIVYQVLVEEKGWLDAKSDGQETIYDKKKPISSFRMAVVPKAEKQSLINKWNKDVGTKNMNE